MTRRVTPDFVSGSLDRRVSSSARPVTLAPTSTLSAAFVGMAALLLCPASTRRGFGAPRTRARARGVVVPGRERAQARRRRAPRLRLFFPWAKQTVVVQVWRENRRYQARLQLVDANGLAHGTRALASDQSSCAELFDAAALAISIAMDSLPKDEPPPASPPTPTHPSPRPHPHPSPRPRPRPAHARRPRAHAHARARARPAPLPPCPRSRTRRARRRRRRAGPRCGRSRVRGPSRARRVRVSRGGRRRAGVRREPREPRTSSRLVAPGHRSCRACPSATHRCAPSASWGSCTHGARASPTRAPELHRSSLAGRRVGFDWPLSERFSLRSHLDATADTCAAFAWRSGALMPGRRPWSLPPPRPASLRISR